MKTNKPSTRFWTLLALINGVAAVHPVYLILQGGNTIDSFLATVILVPSSSCWLSLT